MRVADTSHAKLVDARCAAYVCRSLRRDDAVARVVNPPPSRFLPLALTAGLSAGALQAVFLASAPSLGMNVNRDAALMAPLHWTVM